MSKCSLDAKPPSKTNKLNLNNSSLITNNSGTETFIENLLPTKCFKHSEVYLRESASFTDALLKSLINLKFGRFW